MPILSDAEPSVRPDPPPGMSSAHASVAADRGRWIAAAARQALTTPWHLAVIAGPDEGMVIPLPTGRAVIGRASGSSTDPGVGREAFSVVVAEGSVELEAASNSSTRRACPHWRARQRAAGLARELRWPLLPRSVAARPRGERALFPGQRRRWQPAERIRLGDSVWELRARPREIHPPPEPRGWGGLAPMLPMLALPLLLIPLVLLRSRVMGMSGRGAWSLLLFAPLLLMMVLRMATMHSGRRSPRRRRSSRREGVRLWRGRRFDPCAALLLLASDLPSPPEEILCGWIADRRRRFRWEIHNGDRIAVVGAGDQALRTAAHVLLMARVNGARISCSMLPGSGNGKEAGKVGLSWRLSWGAGLSSETASLDQSPPSAGRFAAELCLTTGKIPAHSTRCPPLLQGLPPLPIAWLFAAMELASPGTSASLHPTASAGTPSFQTVMGTIDRDLVGCAWAQTPGGAQSLNAVLGLCGEERQRISLIEHGPHALLAGTTGSGKSELLTSWLLQLACQSSPEALCLILVDYKGGAAFGPLTHLPHTAGVLTDLAPELTDRVLRALEAELARRERRLAAAHLSDWRHLHDGQPAPRIIIAVDEFQVLAQAHAEVLDALLRIAAQGRSLGMHLILSTQRPHGAISPSIRANTALRLCMRVLDGADSREVLGTELAASPDLPPGSVFIAGPTSSPSQSYLSPWCDPAEQDVLSIVSELRAAAQDQGVRDSSAPWAPPLPERRERSIEEAWRGLLAYVDEPAQQQWQAWSWDDSEPLVLLGAPRSGRSTLLESVALGEMSRSLSPSSRALGASSVHSTATTNALPSFHAVHWAMGSKRLAAHPALAEHRETWGSALSMAQPRALSDLWHAAAEGSLDGDLLLIDDLEAQMACLEHLLGPGQAQPLWEGILRKASAGQLRLVVTAALTSASARWVSSFSTRLYLGVHDAAAAAMAGLPRSLAASPIPGRGVLWRQGEALPCQLLLPAPAEAAGLRNLPFAWPLQTHSSSLPAHLLPSLPGTEEPCAARRFIRELPTSFPASTECWALIAPHAMPAALPRRHVFVAGPPGSGRTETLKTLQGILPNEKPFIIWDFHPATSEQIRALQSAHSEGRHIMLATTITELGTALRTTLAPLRDEATLILLSPSSAEASQLLGSSARPHLDPLQPQLPGRGILINGALVRTIQVGLMGRVSSATSR